MSKGSVQIVNFRDHPMQRVACALSLEYGYQVVSTFGKRVGYNNLTADDNHHTLHVIAEEPGRTRKIFGIFRVTGRPRRQWVLDITPDRNDPHIWRVEVFGKMYEELAHRAAAALISALEQESILPPYSIGVTVVQDTPRSPHFGL